MSTRTRTAALIIVAEIHLNSVWMNELLTELAVTFVEGQKQKQKTKMDKEWNERNFSHLSNGKKMLLFKHNNSRFLMVNDGCHISFRFSLHHSNSIENLIIRTLKWIHTAQLYLRAIYQSFFYFLFLLLDHIEKSFCLTKIGKFSIKDFPKINFI